MTNHKYIILLILFVSIPIIGCFAQYQVNEYLALKESEIVFADGIRAELKKGSKITIPLYFNGQEVNTILSGEASFEVLAGNHLTVEFNRLIVKATRASFSITEGKGIIEVTALEGKISMWVNREQIIVRQFQRAVYDMYTKQISIIDTKIKRA
jgi:ferric-dicitrate binding protein FerR (iron transport regulator)